MALNRKIKKLNWYNHILKLKDILLELQKTITNQVYIETITGDVVDNTDPTNPVINRGYKVYTAKITQSGISNPTIIIFENTIGNIVWERIAQGQYTGTLDGVFINDKTYTQIKASYDSGEDAIFGINVANLDSVVISSSPITTLIPDDDLLNNIDLEIRIYN